MARLTEEGKYIVEVTNAYLTESANKGTIGVVFEFKCDEGTIECTKWATPNTIDYLWADLETLGFTKKHAEDMDNLDRLAEICSGHQCQITCEDKEYHGEVALQVKWINNVGGMRSTKPETKAGLHALLNGNSFTRSAPRSSSPARPEPPPNSPMNDEKLPF